MALVGDLLRDVPPITKLLCGGSALIHLLVYVNIVSQFDVYFNLNLIISKFQLWRIITNLLFFGDLSIFTLFTLMMIYRCSKRLEVHTFRNKTADYLFFLLLGLILMTIFGAIFGATSLAQPFWTMLIYLWSMYNKNVVLLLFGLIPMKAPYVTWFFVVINIISKESILYDILGIAIGHTYYFLRDVYPNLPQSKGVVVLKTPRFLVRLVEILKLEPREGIIEEDDIIFNQVENANQNE